MAAKSVPRSVTPAQPRNSAPAKNVVTTLVRREPAKIIPVPLPAGLNAETPAISATPPARAAAALLTAEQKFLKMNAVRLVENAAKAARLE